MRPTLPGVGTAVVALVLAAAPAVAAPSTDALISEVYGGGGNSGATLKQDFVELANKSASAISLDGYSVQYISATPGASTQWGVTPLTGSIAPGKTFLVAEAKGTGGTVDLPAPDATGTIAMSGTGGTIALVNGTAALTCKTAADCAADPRIKDLVGYGTAVVREGTATNALSNTTSAFRNIELGDTDDNATDFKVGDPNPTNSKGETPGGGNPDPDPDPVPGDKRIHDIQGVTRISPLLGQKVTNVPGVVTGTRATGDRGFWIQDTTSPDADPRTSEGVFVYTAGTAPTVAVGDSVLVSGTIAEYRPGGETGSNQTLTEITQPTTLTVSKGNPVPAPVVVRNIPGGYLPAPGGSIEQLPLEPEKYGLDYFESLEGTLVQVNDARVVGPSNAFGEVWVTVNPDQNKNLRGGTTYTAYDQANSGRLKIKATPLPVSNVGDVFSGATVGAIEYTNFGGYTLAALTLGQHVSSDLQREITAQQKESELSVATYNVENLDPSDPQSKFDRLAEGVTTNLRSPDVVVLEEIQDNNGATNDGVVAADQTLQKFSDAIVAKGGPRYQWRQIDPENLKDGGEPGGNIRVGFFFNPQRVSFVDRPGGDFKTAVEVVKKNGRAALSVSPGRIDPLNDAWANSRKPLAGEFKFRGRTVFVVANHFNSKGGDEAIHGRNQPPNRSSEVQRAKQSAALKAFTEQIRAIDKGANVVLAGDLNDYQFSPAVKALTGDGNLKALIETLPANERYSYVFEGNSQTLDHLVLSKNITRFSYDVVHINAEFADQASDHDPQIVRARPSTGDANIDKLVFALEDILDCLKK
ncbi:lamin tail domain-containing protein [Lentzea sp. BCCO 10_0856]|uniref:Lamin tail domain-containing protein n=1 Tax=Lentzea miocenica TaxID=3095431 RepID=A0ABU4T2E2_9PSEU|nr:endonuclease/exonuclease/phosphatase family protein [Lentzea sp. BCCO 10_0856]MDX8032324.1 lamin tail domain-containing protein [Lentzea sp. BCCO 10_0856]